MDCILRGKKDSALLSSRDGYLLEPTVWRKGSEASYGVWMPANAGDTGLISGVGRSHMLQGATIPRRRDATTMRSPYAAVGG